MRTSSFTMLMIAMLLIVILLALVVIIGLAITIHDGTAPEGETSAIQSFILWADYFMTKVISAAQDVFTYFVTWIENFSKSL